MRITVLGLVLAAVAATGNTRIMAAEDNPAAPGPVRPNVMFARMDKNGDKKLSMEEFAEGMKVIHSQAALRQPMGFQPGMVRGPMMGAGPRGSHFGQWGGPRPIHPSMRGQAWRGGMRGGWRGAEWWGAPWVQHGWYRPGFGGPRPFGPMHHPTGMPARGLQALDKDKDGKISKSEAPERLLKHFDRTDENKDGLLDRTELAKAFRAVAHRGREAAAEAHRDAGRKSHEARKAAAQKKHDRKKQGERKADEKKDQETKVPEKKSDEKQPDEKKADEKKS